MFTVKYYDRTVLLKVKSLSELEAKRRTEMLHKELCKISSQQSIGRKVLLKTEPGFLTTLRKHYHLCSWRL